MTSEWDVISCEKDLFITGPGELEIIVPSFSSSKASIDRLDERLFKEWKQVTVRYPLENLVALEITITTNKNDTVSMLSIGEWVVWYTDLEFGDKLQSILLGKYH